MVRSLKLWEKYYYSTRSRCGIPYNDIKNNSSVGFLSKLKMWKMGFLSDKVVAYDFKNYKANRYLTDHQQAMTRFINYPYSAILNNKLVFEKVFSNQVKVPKSYAIIDNGSLLLLDPEFTDVVTNANDIYRSIKEMCFKCGNIVLKPIKGALGKGVFIVTCINEYEFLVNNKLWTKEKLSSYLGSLKLCLVSEYLDQANYSKQLYPNATNTLRVVTMINPVDNKAFIAVAVKRMGTDQSAPVDNNSNGGICASINLETGELSSASQFTKSIILWHDYHPNSGTQIKGIQIPKWTSIKENVLSLANRNNFLKYVGWDVLEQNNGIAFLEGNNHPRFRLHQIHKPILEDQRVVDFYKYHKII